jgi:hypothetical protein
MNIIIKIFSPDPYRNLWHLPAPTSLLISMCLLCKQAQEMMNHLFNHCSMFKELWLKSQRMFKTHVDPIWRQFYNSSTLSTQLALQHSLTNISSQKILMITYSHVSYSRGNAMQESSLNAQSLYTSY